MSIGDGNRCPSSGPSACLLISCNKKKNNRATRFKQKYYNDKTYTTPEMEASEQILNSLKENPNSQDNKLEENTTTDNNADCNNISNTENQDIVIEKIQDKSKQIVVMKDTIKDEVPTAVHAKVDKIPINIVSEDKLLKTECIVTRAESIEEINDNKNKVANVGNEEQISSKPEIQGPIIDIKSSKTNNTDIAESQVVDNKEIDFDDFVFGKVEKKIPKDPVAEPAPLIFQKLHKHHRNRRTILLLNLQKTSRNGLTTSSMANIYKMDIFCKKKYDA